MRYFNVITVIFIKTGRSFEFLNMHSYCLLTVLLPEVCVIVRTCFILWSLQRSIEESFILIFQLENRNNIGENLIGNNSRLLDLFEEKWYVRNSWQYFLFLGCNLIPKKEKKNSWLWRQSNNRRCEIHWLCPSKVSKRKPI